MESRVPVHYKGEFCVTLRLSCRLLGGNEAYYWTFHTMQGAGTGISSAEVEGAAASPTICTARPMTSSSNVLAADPGRPCNKPARAVQEEPPDARVLLRERSMQLQKVM